MAESIPLAELELRILLLPPISRGVHLGGPVLHARRLAQLWRGGAMTAGEIDEASDDELLARRTILTEGSEAETIEAELQARAAKRAASASVSVPLERPKPSDRADHWGDDDVPLSQAFRLLDVEAVARAILRTALLSNHDYPNDPIHWPLPPLNDLLPELNDAAWQAVLDGELQIEAIRYERGKTGLAARPVPLVELPRLQPDWKLSRLCRDDRDEWLDARVCRAPVELPKREPKPKKSDLKIAMEEVAATYPPGAHPPSREIWRALDDLAGPGVTRAQAREALAKHAPHLRGERGRPRKSPV